MAGVRKLSKGIPKPVLESLIIAVWKLPKTLETEKISDFKILICPTILILLKFKPGL